jgi:Zn-dependent protease/CBS domain-containing protein
MKGSLRIARVAGIGIFVHWTFAILLAFVAVKFLSAGQGNPVVMFYGIALVLAVFLCVILHELGHALTARRYGIRTRDITLLPIGGIARLERMPEDPKQELLVAIAGPAVNVVIAAVLSIAIVALGGTDVLLSSAEKTEAAGLHFREGTVEFLVNLAVVNVILVLFNLLPAFPMDGGRVLRALLGFRMPFTKATQIAATIGQGMAILFGVWGLFRFDPILLLIALFIYIAGQAEAQMVQTRAMFQGVTVRQAMITRFATLAPDDRLAAAVDALLEGNQQDFPVVESGRLVGILTRTDLVRGLAQAGPDGTVREVMRGDCAMIDEAEPLDAAFTRMQQNECSTLPVSENGQLVGLITLENVSEWIMVQNALGHQGDGDAAMA